MIRRKRNRNKSKNRNHIIGTEQIGDRWRVTYIDGSWAWRTPEEVERANKLGAKYRALQRGVA